MSRSVVPKLALALSLGLVAPMARAETTHECVEAAHEGQRLRDGGKLSSARDAFLTCSVPACPSVVRESCERWLGEIEPRLPTIVVGARDDAGNDLYEVGVSIDGRELATRLDGRSIAVDPGPHELVFQAHGFAPVRQFIVAREGEKVRHVVALFGASPPATREPPRRRDPAPLVIAGAAGALGLSGFAVFGLWGSRDRDQLAETCAPTQTCRSADVRAARTKLIVADASLLVGIAGAGVFTALMLIPLFEKPRTSPVSVSIAPSPRGVFSAVEYRY